MTIRIWDLSTGLMIGEPIEGHTGYVESIACSPDGEHFVSGSYDESLRIWDASTGKLVRLVGIPLRGHHTGAVKSVAYSPNSAHIVSGSRDQTIRIWDARTGNRIGKPFRGHTAVVNAVAYSPDGRNIISGSEDRTIRIWDALSGEMIGNPFKGHSNIISSVAYSPDGARIASGSWDNTVRIWDAYTGQADDSRGFENSSDYDGNSVNPEDAQRGQWTLKEDGWVVLDNSKLLVWVPHEVREDLQPPRNIFVCPQGSFVKLDWNNAFVGVRWRRCYKP
ncbi:hypothetical protein FS749_008615 [Ceratobasidium sp. UAMH 11750]|nr:hypothetical protein FS749_008615 [Ceratobasidium sp. UAMH 11750]